MQLLSTAILLVQVATLQASGRQKRLVLHADTDIVQEIVKLRAEMAALNNTYRNDIEHLKTTQQAELQNLNNTYQNDVQNLKGVINHINITHHADMESLERAYVADITSFMSKMKDTFKEHGSTYIRWGKTSCGSGNGTQMIYKGYMAGSNYYEGGSGDNQQCLPEDPTWGRYDDGSQADRGYIYGAEFQEQNNNIFGKYVLDEDVPCVVCHVPGTSLMIPARATCYPGWFQEYTGYLMTALHGKNGPSNYVCVDSDPDFVTRGAANTDGHLLYLVEGICGTLVCPPYFNHR